VARTKKASGDIAVAGGGAERVEVLMEDAVAPSAGSAGTGTGTINGMGIGGVGTSPASPKRNGPGSSAGGETVAPVGGGVPGVGGVAGEAEPETKVRVGGKGVWGIGVGWLGEAGRGADPLISSCVGRIGRGSSSSHSKSESLTGDASLRILAASSPVEEGNENCGNAPAG
jgi:hypothetical protein